MTGDLGTYIVFALGILVGGILFNKDFRQKFFRGFRGFLSQIGRGAREQNRLYGGGRREPSRRESSAPARDKPEVQHIYKQVHTSRTCETCQGSGRVFEKPSPLQEGAPGFKPKVIDCPDCGGEGRRWN